MTPTERSGRFNFVRFATALAFGISAFASAASAFPALPGYRENDWALRFKQPVHLQARVVSTPVMGWKESVLDGPCEADAVALRSFRGAALIRVRQRFTFRWHCDGQWFMEGHPAPPPFHVADPVGGAGHEVRRGEVLELFLGADGWIAPWGMADGLHEMERPTATPTVVLDDPPPGLDAQYLGDAERRPEMPVLVRPGPPIALFPRRDETVTFRTSAEPGRVLAASYVAATHAIVVVPADGKAGRWTRTILRPDVGLATEVDDRGRVYARRHVDDGIVRSDGIIRHAPEVVGHERIAGVDCTDFEMEDFGGNARPIMGTVAACIAADGTRLRRTTPDGTTETAISVRYGQVDPGSAELGDGYSRAPAEDDDGKVRYPPILTP